MKREIMGQGRPETITAISPRLNFIDVHTDRQPQTFLNVVREGLSKPRKSLPCRFFYDSVGSHLFEQICQLPEYYLTRTEQRILEAKGAEIVRSVGADAAMVEFGSGSSCKTRLLIEAMLAAQAKVHYLPIDISRDFLHASALTLLSDYENLSITAIAAEYNAGMEVLPPHAGPRLILFLGSNIGNFTRPEAIAFLSRIRRVMQPQDRLLIGVDLVKARAVLEAAYNDSQEVTAAFNKNLLVRINSELGADFDLDAFFHSAPFVEEEARIEMRLVSRRPQKVTLAASGDCFSFEQGEFIHTEYSHKYTIARFASISEAVDLEIQDCWTDPREWFGLLLLKPRGEV